MATTLSQLRSAVRNEMKVDRTWKIWNDAEVNDAINTAYTQVQTDFYFRWQETLTETTFSTVVDQQEYPFSWFAPNLVTIDVVRFNNITMDSIDYEEYKYNYEWDENVSWTPRWYYVRNNSIWLVWTPKVVWTVEVIYRTALEELVNDADTIGFPDNFKRSIVLYASYVLFTKLSGEVNINAAKTKKTRYQEEVDRLKLTDALLDQGQIQYKNTYRSPSLLRTTRSYRITRRKYY